MSQQVYFLKRGEKLIGPYNVATIKKLSEDFKIKPTDLVSRAKDGPWHKFGDVENKLYGTTTPTALTTSKPAGNPNLMACPDCNGSMSKKAKACPHCGSPNELASTMDDTSANFGVLDYVPPVMAPIYRATVPTPKPPSTPSPATDEKPNRNKQLLIAVGGGLLSLLVVVGGGFLAYSALSSGRVDSDTQQVALVEPTEPKVAIRKDLFSPIHRLLVQHSPGESTDTLQAELKLLEPAIESGDERSLFGMCEKSVELATALMVLDLSRRALLELADSRAKEARQVEATLPSLSGLPGGTNSEAHKLGRYIIELHEECSRAVGDGYGIFPEGNPTIIALLQKLKIEKVAVSNTLKIGFIEYAKNKDQLTLAFNAYIDVFGKNLHGKPLKLYDGEREQVQNEVREASVQDSSLVASKSAKAEQLREKLRSRLSSRSESTPATDGQKLDLNTAFAKLVRWINDRVQGTRVHGGGLELDEKNQGIGTVKLELIAEGRRATVEFKVAYVDKRWRVMSDNPPTDKDLFSASFDEESEISNESANFKNWAKSQGDQIIQKVLSSDSWLG